MLYGYHILVINKISYSYHWTLTIKANLWRFSLLKINLKILFKIYNFRFKKLLWHLRQTCLWCVQQLNNFHSDRLSNYICNQLFAISEIKKFWEPERSFDSVIFYLYIFIFMNFIFFQCNYTFKKIKCIKRSKKVYHLDFESSKNFSALTLIQNFHFWIEKKTWIINCQKRVFF